MKVDANRAECLVFTYKEGLLSRVGHDLKLRCDRFTVDLTDERVEATFDAGAFTCVSAMKDGRETGGLSDKDKKQVLENMRKGVLHPERFPEIRFVSTSMKREGTILAVEGDLSLHGKTRRLKAQARIVDGHWRVEVDLHTPDHGIPAFSALLGTLKVKPRVTVRLRVPVEG